MNTPVDTSSSEVLAHISSRYKYWADMGAVKDPQQFEADLNDPSYGFDEEGPTQDPVQMLYASDLQSLREIIRSATEGALPSDDAPEGVPEEANEEEPMSRDMELRVQAFGGALEAVDHRFLSSIPVQAEASYGTPFPHDPDVELFVWHALVPLMHLLGLTKVVVQPLDRDGAPIDMQDTDAQIRWSLEGLEKVAPLLAYLKQSGPPT